jgi:hypothetical protein
MSYFGAGVSAQVALRSATSWLLGPRCVMKTSNKRLTRRERPWRGRPICCANNCVQGVGASVACGAFAVTHREQEIPTARYDRSQTRTAQAARFGAPDAQPCTDYTASVYSEDRAKPFSGQLCSRRAKLSEARLHSRKSCRPCLLAGGPRQSDWPRACVSIGPGRAVRVGNRYSGRMSRTQSWSSGATKRASLSWSSALAGCFLPVRGSNHCDDSLAGKNSRRSRIVPPCGK